MSTYAQICEDAYLEAGVLPLGGTLSLAQQAQGLRILEQIIREATTSIGYPWIDVEGVDGYVAGEDERVFIDSALTITLPDYVSFEGEGTADAYDSEEYRTPQDMARVQIVRRDNSTNTLWFYRADLANWVEATFSANDEMPFGEDLDMSLAAMLALRLAQRTGAEIAPHVPGLAQRGLSKLRSKGRRPSTIMQVEYF